LLNISATCHGSAKFVTLVVVRGSGMCARCQQESVRHGSRQAACQWRTPGQAEGLTSSSSIALEGNFPFPRRPGRGERGTSCMRASGFGVSSARHLSIKIPMSRCPDKEFYPELIVCQERWASLGTLTRVWSQGKNYHWPPSPPGNPNLQQRAMPEPERAACDPISPSN
jgi:hypothetical protein